MRLQELIPVFAALMFSSPAIADGPAALAPMDVFQLSFASQPEISPDGEWVVYNKSSPDIMTDEYAGEMRVVRTDGSEDTPLMKAPGFAAGAAWSPTETKLAYVAGGAGPLEIRIYDPITRETEMAAAVTEGFPASLSWSIDGKRLAYTIFERSPQKSIGVMPASPEGAKWKSPPTIIDRLDYRNADGSISREGIRQLYVLDLATGERKKVSNFSRSMIARGEPLLWTTDGESLIVTGYERSDPDRYQFETNLYRVSLVDGSFSPITRRKGYEGDAQLSPQGDKIAFIGYNENYPGNPEQYQNRLFVLDLQTGSVQRISSSLDREVSRPRWAHDGESVNVQYDDHGVTKIAQFGLDGSHKEVAENLGTFILAYSLGASYSVSRSGVIALSYKTASIPGDIAIVDAPGAIPTRITHLNDALLSKRELGEVREINYRSRRDRLNIQGWYILPPGYDETKQYPLILEIHGGPYANYGPRFDIEKQLMAAAGYIVLYVNPRGSTSYGSDFVSKTFEAYPGRDLEDLKSGVDALSRMHAVDKAKIYVVGGSGGGILAGAMLASYPDLFAAAAVLYPITDWRSYMLSAAPWIEVMQATFKSPPWINDPSYFTRSIISKVDRIKTPTLVFVGERDFQAPVFQAEGLYRALKWNEVESTLAIMPDETHGLRDHPSHLISKIATILGWLEKHPN